MARRNFRPDRDDIGERVTTKVGIADDSQSHLSLSLSVSQKESKMEALGARRVRERAGLLVGNSRRRSPPLVLATHTHAHCNGRLFAGDAEKNPALLDDVRF